MIDALIAGKLFGAAVERTGSSGKAYVTCKVRAADSDGEGQFINVVAFDERVRAALLALGDGDSVSVSGAMKVDTYEARDGTTRISINMVASAVLTSYHVRRRRDAIAASQKPSERQARAARKHGGLREAEALYGEPAPSMEDRLDEPF